MTDYAVTRPDFETRYPDWHAVTSIQLGELIEGGAFDWENDKSLIWDYYDEEQYKRVCNKFVNHFLYREIGIIPFGQWRLAYVRRMNEIMPKYKFIYKALDNGIDPLQSNSEYGKERHIYSNFPATQLGDNQDYADTGVDREYEYIKQKDFLDILEKITKISDVDKLILDECETLFSAFLYENVNGIF